MATKKTVTATAGGKSPAKLAPVQIVYKGRDFGAIDPRIFLDKRFQMTLTRIQRAAKSEDNSAGMDLELTAYELIFGADNVDDVFNALADLNGGFVSDDNVRDFLTFIMEETKAKNS